MVSKCVGWGGDQCAGEVPSTSKLAHLGQRRLGASVLTRPTSHRCTTGEAAERSHPQAQAMIRPLLRPIVAAQLKTRCFSTPSQPCAFHDT
jgi:hypothetical protein